MRQKDREKDFIGEASSLDIGNNGIILLRFPPNINSKKMKKIAKGVKKEVSNGRGWCPIILVVPDYVDISHISEDDLRKSGLYVQHKGMKVCKMK